MISKGDLFYTSWGYDQTNYDYIMVLKISKTGKTCKCQRARHQFLGNDGYGSDIQKPIKEGFGEVFQMRIQESKYFKVSLRGSYPFLHTGEGSKRLDSFFPVTEGSTYAETDAYHGH